MDRNLPGAQIPWGWGIKIVYKLGVVKFGFPRVLDPPPLKYTL